MKSRLLLPVFYFLLFSIGIRAQSNALSKSNCDLKSDSVLIAHYVDSLNKAFLPEDMSSFTGGKFYYGPGNYFKILVMEGQSCGAYCNPMYYSWVFYEEKNVLIQKQIDFSPVTNMYELKSKKNGAKEFLIIDNTWCRPRGVESGTQKSFCHLIISDTARLDTIRLQEKKDSNVYFWIYTGVLCDDTIAKINEPLNLPELDFNPKTKIISYRYFEYLDYFGHCYEVKGTFKYVNGEFVQQFETDNFPKEED